MKEKKKPAKHNSGRRNNTDNYHDRPSLENSQELLGEDIGQLGKGKGGERKRLANEIEDNMYDPETVVEVSSDPREWGEGFQISFAESKRKDYEVMKKKYIKIIKRSYDWLRDDTQGKQVTSVVGLRSQIGMSKYVWDSSVNNSEEFEYYAGMISQLIGGRIHDLGIKEGRGQIFKIFSLKNHLPDDFADKKEVSTHGTIEVIQVGQGDKESIQKAIDDSKERLSKGKK